jgi:hypothetical protein
LLCHHGEHVEARKRAKGEAAMIEKILVPLDGSDLAETALETAINILNEKPGTTPVLRAPSRPAGSRIDG